MIIENVECDKKSACKRENIGKSSQKFERKTAKNVKFTYKKCKIMKIIVNKYSLPELCVI